MVINIPEIFSQKKWLNRKEILVGMICSSLAINILALSLPLVILQLYDRIIPNQSTSTLSLLVVGAIVAIFLESILKFCRYYIASIGENRLQKHYHKDVFAKMLSSNKSPDNFNYILDKLSTLENIKVISNVNTISSLFDIPFIIIFLAMICYISPVLFLIVVTIPSLLFLYSIKYQNKYIAHQMRQKLYNSKKSNLIFETIRNLGTIKFLGTEETQIIDNEKYQAALSLEEFNYSHFFGNLNKIIATSTQITLIIVVCISALFVIQDKMSFGWMAACTILTSRTIFPLSKIIASISKHSVIKILQHELKDLDNNEININAKKNTISNNPNIKLQDIYIKCTITGKNLIEDLNLELSSPGANLILGSNDSGKNSILKLINGNLKPNAGALYIDDTNIHVNKIAINNNEIQFIDLDGDIFNGSIMDNITLFDNTIEEKIAKSAATIINLDAEIKKLPNGYHTKIGNTAASTLPLKICQLIILARCIVNRAKIVLIDASNVAFDARLLCKIVQLLKQESLVIVTAAKLHTTIDTFDSIFLLTGKKLNPITKDKSLNKKQIITLSSQNVITKR